MKIVRRAISARTALPVVTVIAHYTTIGNANGKY